MANTPINIHLCINVSADQGSSQSTYTNSTSKLITQGKAAPSAINNLLGYIRGSGSILKSILILTHLGVDIIVIARVVWQNVLGRLSTSSLCQSWYIPL